MAETAISAFAKLVLGNLASLLTQELKLSFGVEDQLHILKSNFSAIRAVLRDAERQQSTTESVKEWLESLEDLVYEIDDLLDEISYEALLEERNQGDWYRKVRKFCSSSNSLLFRSKLGHRMKGINGALERIAKRKENWTFSTLELTDLDERRDTSSNLPDWEIIGREEERKSIVDLVLSLGDCESLSVIPILGLGGIGKTTLATLVYNDETIHANFGRRIWVCVSENMKVRKILEEVLKLLPNSSGENAREMSLEELHIKLSVALKGEKYLLVLDDFWNDDPDAWGRLRSILDRGAKGSTVIVTTRESQVAAIVKTIPNKYTLHGLPSHVCLKMFKKIVFREGSPRSSKFQRMADEIVSKCDGSPLTVTVLANLLRCQTNESVWEDVVLELQKGNRDLLRVLKLSYDRLPSYLKPCFRVMPIYPKGADLIYFPHLVSTWMALGFLQLDDDNDQNMERTGRNYMHQLLAKSLLDNPEFIIGDRLHCFKIHDCINDMARLVAGDEVAVITCSLNKVSEKARYVLLDEENLLGREFRKEVLKSKKARVFSLYSFDQNLDAFIESIITKFKSLRVLDLGGCGVQKLPSSIGNLKHLRMLNLRASRISKLPFTVCDLLKLQTLLLHGCMKLQELPPHIGRLKMLRHLTLTTKQKHLPSEMGSLIALRKLTLYQCHALTSFPQSMRNTENLEELWIMSCDNMDMMSSASTEVFQRWNHLHILVMNDLPRFTGLPTEVGGPSVSLRYLEIQNCQNMTDLSGWIEQFSALEGLNLVQCLSLLALPNNLPKLERLEKLAIYGCPALRRRCERNTGDDWHLISHITDIQIKG